MYIHQYVTLNGEKLNRNYLHINEILKGGILSINKTKNSNDKWECDEFYNTEINDNLHILKYQELLLILILLKILLK